jgi:nucleoside-diphosphate-sugar epimerase
VEQDRKPSFVNRRCLIVGCGYVGLPLGAELVRLGHEVFGLRRSATEGNELEAAGISPLLADITQPRTLAQLPHQFDWVINCVAAGGGAENYRRVYLEGTQNLIEWLSAAPPEKFVYASSTSVYAQDDGSLVTEQSPAEPLAETAKVLRETEGVLFDRFQQEKFPVVILRVAGIYGPGRGHWFKQFLRGEARIEGDGSRFLNMIHRDDVAGCIITALQRGRAGEIYNAADDEPVSQVQLFEWLAAELKRPLPPKVSADAEIRRKRGATNKRVSNAKLKAELKYEFKFPDFRAGYAAEIRRITAKEHKERKEI